jgi:hypothetical protein
MTLITRSVHNPRSIPCPIRIPGYEATAPVITIAPSATVDFLTIITEDNLIAVQDNLNELVSGGALTVTATVDTATFEEGYTGTATSIVSGTSEPLSPIEGQVFYKTTTHQFEGWNGTAWVLLG